MTEPTNPKAWPLPASWPQQKAIWSICNRTCLADPKKYPACDFTFWKIRADGGALTRKDASDIIKSYYDVNPALFATLVRKHSPNFELSVEKFQNAERRHRKHKTERYYGDKPPEEEEKRQPQESEGEGTVPTPGPTGPPPIPDDEYAEPFPEIPMPDVPGFKEKMDEAKEAFRKKARELAEAAKKEGERIEREKKEKARQDAERAANEYLERRAREEEEKRKAKEEEEKRKFTPVDPDYVKPDIFDDVCLMIKNGVQVLLVGPSGCGKSMLITQVKKVLEKGLYVESFAGGKRYAQVFGSTHLVDGKSEWIPAEFLKAIQKPGIVFMDEVMSADADVLIGCNSILDRKTRCFHTPEGVIEAHPECVIVGASNVSGREYSQNYKGTQQQDASVLNRFVHVPMTYDKRVEKELVKKSELPSAVQEKILAWLNSLRQKISINNIQYDPSTRKLVQTIELIKMGMKADKAFTYSFLTPLSEIEKKKIGDVTC